jgi:hypothetical protein
MWEWRPTVEKAREWNVASRRLKGCSPHLCRLRTDRLAPRASIERTNHILVFMGPVSIVACRQQMIGLSILIQWPCRERN